MYRFIKRAFDIAVALLALIVSSPIWLIAIIGIEISDLGPIFYVAHRVGKDNREFRMMKFRSMRVAKNARENGFKAETKRIFPFGEFMRASKIDELPQLLNILCGTMTIVGPRPASVDQVQLVRTGNNAIVSTMTSGLTGPSALYDYIYGDTIKDEVEYREKVLPTRLALDVWYVGHCRTTLDLRMIWWTVICILAEVFHKKTPKILSILTAWGEEQESLHTREYSLLK